METFANQAVTTLSAAITTVTATSCTVTDASMFPATGNFRIKIDAEILIVTGVAGSTFTITRGAEGTTAATHGSGASVIHLLTKGSLEARVANRFISDIYDNKPAAGMKGRLFLPTDGLFIEYDDGSAWHKYGPYRRLKAPPQTGWSWVNQGNATATFTGSALILEDPDMDATSPQFRLYVRPFGAGTTTLTVAFVFNGISSDAPKMGFCVRSVGGGSDDGNFTTWGIRQGSTSSAVVPALQLYNYSSPTAGEGSIWSYDHSMWPFGRLFWVKYVWAGENKQFWYSTDGVNWILWLSVSLNSGSNPMQFGLFLDPTNNAQKVSLSLVHWEES